MQISLVQRTLGWAFAFAIGCGFEPSAPAQAGPIVATCPAPMAPRRALPDDSVCVMPDSRERIAAENARAALLWIPGPFGPKTCANGYVWREATPRDFTCVTPGIRTLVASEQANPQLAPGQ
jgi:hypothetical protein